MMDRHMMVPKLFRMRILVNAAVGMDASRLVPAALTIVGPRCLIALLTRIHIDVDVVVRIVSDRCRQ